MRIHPRPREHGLLLDYDADGVPVGVEIIAPERITVAVVDDLLRKLGLPATVPDELSPLRVA